MKTQTRKNKWTYNEFYFVGRLCNTPIKDFTKRKELYTRFVLRTCIYRKIKIPFIMFGPDVEVVCTRFHQGDIVAVKGQVSSREKFKDKVLIDFIVREMVLVSKSKIKPTSEDNFLKIIELYDIRNVDKRMNK